MPKSPEQFNSLVDQAHEQALKENKELKDIEGGNVFKLSLEQLNELKIKIDVAQVALKKDEKSSWSKDTAKKVSENMKYEHLSRYGDASGAKYGFPIDSYHGETEVDINGRKYKLIGHPSIGVDGQGYVEYIPMEVPPSIVKEYPILSEQQRVLFMMPKKELDALSKRVKLAEKALNVEFEKWTSDERKELAIANGIKYENSQKEYSVYYSYEYRKKLEEQEQELPDRERQRRKDNRSLYLGYGHYGYFDSYNGEAEIVIKGVRYKVIGHKTERFKRDYSKPEPDIWQNVLEGYLEWQEIGRSKNPVENHEKEKGLRILIVDDEPYNFFQLRDNENITLAQSVDEAEQYLKSGEFDVMLLDGHLGDDDVFDNGPDALVHWTEEGINIPPTFMISSDEKMQKKGIDAGAKGAIAKSLIFSGDITAIEKAIK